MATEASLRLSIDARGARAGAQTWDRSLKDVRVNAKMTRDELGGFVTQTTILGAAAATSSRGVLSLSSAFAILRRTIFSLPALIAGGGLGLFGKSLISAASSAEELESKFRVVFKGVNDDAEAAAQTMARDFKRSIIDVKDAMAGFQDTFVPLGFARGEALKLSDALTKLSFDLSSFYDKSQADVMRDLQSALVGQTETIRKYGAVVLEADTKQEAYRLGLAKTDEEISQQAKILARLSLIYQKTSDAQGDLLRTQDSFSNKIREVQGVVKDLRVEFGQRLIQAIEQAAQGFGGISAITDLVRLGFEGLTGISTLVIQGFATAIFKAVELVKALGGIDAATDLVKQSVRGIGSAFETAGNLAILSLAGLQKGLEVISLAIKGIGALAVTVGQAIGDAIFSGIQSGLRQLQDLNRIKIPFGSVTVFEGLDAAIEATNDSIQKGRDVGKAYADIIQDELKTAADDFVESAQGMPDILNLINATVVKGKSAVKDTTEAWFDLYAAMKKVGAGGPNVGPLPQYASNPTLFGPPQAPAQLDFKSFGLTDATEGAKEYSDALEDVARSQELVFKLDVNRRLAQGFEDAVFEAKNLRDVIKGLAEDIARLFFRQYVTRNLFASLGLPLGNAKGNVFNGGNVVAFAGGGVVGSPTFFPMRNGKTGLMGEAGPEAIMPLTRGADGKLGVKAEGNGSTVTVNMSVNGVRDADSFRRSERQIADSLSRRIGRRL